jgi:hypothetical protein
MSLVQLQREILNNEELGSVRLDEFFQFILQSYIATDIIANVINHIKKGLRYKM